MTFFPQILALLCGILSRQTFKHFLTVMSKNPQHDRVKQRGSRAVYTICKKKHPIWQRMASLCFVFATCQSFKLIFCDLLRFATLLPLHCVVASGFNYLTTSSLCQRRLISSLLSSFQFGPPRQMNPLPQSKTSLYCFNFLYNLKLFQTLGLMYPNKPKYRKRQS